MFFIHQFYDCIWNSLNNLNLKFKSSILYKIINKKKCVNFYSIYILNSLNVNNIESNELYYYFTGSWKQYSYNV